MPMDYGLFKRSRVPMMIEPLELMDRARGETVILLGNVQSFKTLALQQQAIATPALRSRRALWFSQTKPALEDVIYDKLNTSLEQIAAWKRLLYLDKDKNGTTRKIYPEGSLLCRSANIANNRNSKSAIDIYIDEPWLYEDGWLTEILDRKSDYEHVCRVLMATSGPDAGGEVDTMIDESDCREWNAECPHCGSVFPYHWGSIDTEFGMKWETSERTRNPDLSWNWDALIPTIRYVPKCCLEPIEYSVGLQDRMNRGRACYLAVNDRFDSRIHTRQWNALSNKNWNTLVKTWLIANNAKRRGSMQLIENFKRKQLALPYSEVFEHKDTAEPFNFGGYKMREPWADEMTDRRGPLRFMTIDVQKDHYWVTIRKLSKRSESRLHYCSRELTPGNINDLAEREGVFKKRIFIDSGWNTKAVMRLAALYGWIPLNGQKAREFSHDGAKRIFSEPIAEPVALGIHKMRTVAKFYFSTKGGRDLFELWRTMADDELDGSKSYLWTIADDAPQWYREQLKNVVKIKKQRAHGGFYYDYRETGPDHAHDLEVMATVAASMAGFIGIEVDEPEPELEPDPELETAEAAAE